MQALVFAAGKAMQAAGARPPPILPSIASVASQTVSHVQASLIVHPVQAQLDAFHRLAGATVCNRLCTAQFESNVVHFDQCACSAQRLPARRLVHPYHAYGSRCRLHIWSHSYTLTC